jgi:phospholipid/cholesterol/gamma-HCH transport system substrate-binding protein
MSSLRKSTWRRKTQVAAVAACGAMLLSGCEFSVYDLPLPGGADVGDNPYEVTVEFRDVLDLVPQSTVKVDDVTVGTVEEVELDGYSARVTLMLREDVDLPKNAEATIRQTSLLGEKFVSLAPPESNPSPDPLTDGDLIPLERTGRNVEVEEVLGALSLVLNGGGVAQLKTISTELTNIFEGREGSVKSVLEQIRILMSQLDGRKNQIVRALEQVNSLAISLNKETDTLDLALDELPSALASVDRQRNDLIRMLQALSELSSVGTQVIQASEANTIRSLNALAPVLTELADSGDDLANSLQIFLTYPFIDAVVGKNPQTARDLHMGDYTNLSIDLDLNLQNILNNGIGIPGGPTVKIPNCDDIPNPELGQLCKNATGTVIELTTEIIKQLPGGGGGGGTGPIPGVELPRGSSGGTGGGGDGGGILGGLGRAGVGASNGAETRTQVGDIDTDLAAMLMWGVVPR